MKTNQTFQVLLGLCLVAFGTSSNAQISIPSDGSDGALNVTSNTVIDLSQAVTGIWSNNDSANAGKGIYDQGKWAVVFKYSSVSISNGATVTFKNHFSRAPVVWLVNGNVMINGVLNLDGGAGNAGTGLAEPGPGGFRGGASGVAGLWLAGSGLGPGGASGQGSYNYGNPKIVPLIGGSGGGGSSSGGGGGAGGGAILIASVGTITINGSCRANGNLGVAYGSAGAIRLVADQLLGSGNVTAASPSPGRIRVEANVIGGGGLSFNPTADYTIPLPGPPTIWPATNAPTVRLVSVAGQATPGDPLADLPIGYEGDVTIATNGAVTLLFETVNFPTNGTVTVLIKPRNGAMGTHTASYVSGTSNLANWQLQTTLPQRNCVIQARAVGP